MYVYVFMYIYMYVYIYVYIIYINTYTCIYSCIYMHRSLWPYIKTSCMYTYIFVPIYIHTQAVKSHTSKSITTTKTAAVAYAFDGSPITSWRDGPKLGDGAEVEQTNGFKTYQLASWKTPSRREAARPHADRLVTFRDETRDSHFVNPPWKARRCSGTSVHIYVRRLVLLICLGHGGRAHCALTHISCLFYLVVTEGVLGIRPLCFPFYIYSHISLFCLFRSILFLFWGSSLYK